MEIRKQPSKRDVGRAREAVRFDKQETVLRQRIYGRNLCKFQGNRGTNSFKDAQKAQCYQERLNS